MAKTNKNSTEDSNQLHKKLLELWNRGQSKLCEVRDSDIHGRGVYASTFIPKESRIIEYIGELIGKEESEKRAVKQQARAEKSGDAAVYIFTLSKNYDIDGNVPWNTARLINHSCNPNCEAWIIGRKIYIYSLRDIQKGEELSFDYGFDVECFEDHICRCGSQECIGYIVSRSQWPDLKVRLEEKAKTKK